MLSERERTTIMQNNPLLAFEVDQQVQVKPEYEKVCGGRSIKGYVNSIIIDRNGVYYEVIYNNGKTFEAVKLMENFLEGSK